MKNEEFELNVEKCFKKPIASEIDKKEFSEENYTIKVTSSESKNNKDKKLSNSFNIIKYLIENINLETNFKAKLIYLDLYLNLITSESEIMDNLDDLMKTTTNNIIEEKNKISLIENKLNDTKIRLSKYEIAFNSLVEYFKQKDPKFKIENLK